MNKINPKIFVILVLSVSIWSEGVNSYGDRWRQKNRFSSGNVNPNPTTPAQSFPPAQRNGQKPRDQCTIPPPKPHDGKIFTVGILMYDVVEVLDFAGPFEVFGNAGLYFNKFKVVLISDKKNIRARNGLNVVADHVIGQRGMPKLNVLVIPGSDQNGTIAALNHPAYVKWIREVEPKLDYVISVCTGVSFMCRAGFADGLDLTTHHGVFEIAERECPRSKLFRDRRFTDNGRILSSAGISAGIDVSLYFVKKLLGSDAADWVVSVMEYAYLDYSYDKCRGVIPGQKKPFLKEPPRLT